MADGEPAGRLYVDRLPAEIRIVDIALLPAYRGRGLGTAGTAAVAERLAMMGRVSSLYVNGFNHPARRAYDKVGFTRVASFATVLF